MSDDDIDIGQALRQVDVLCLDYHTTVPAHLVPRCHAALRDLDVAARRHPSAAADLDVARGWTTLLISHSLHDAGRHTDAAAVAAGAQDIGDRIGHPLFAAWVRESEAWQANVEGRHADAIRTARDAADAAGGQYVAAQLRFQEALARAHYGDGVGARAGLRAAAQVLDRLALSDGPCGQFDADRGRGAWYALRVYDVLGDGQGVAEHATATLAWCLRPDGDTAAPIRVAETRMAMAHAAARRRDLDAAADLGLRALAYDRKCLPTLLPRARDLVAALRGRAPAWALRGARREFRGRLAAVAGGDGS